MQLLSQLHTQGSRKLLPHGADLGTLVTRIWPCFRHTLVSVRRASIQCLSVLLPSTDAQATSWLTEEQLTTALRLTFQNLVVELDDAILQASQRLWSKLLGAAKAVRLAGIPKPVLEVRSIANLAFLFNATKKQCRTLHSNS